MADKANIATIMNRDELPQGLLIGGSDTLALSKAKDIIFSSIYSKKGNVEQFSFDSQNDTILSFVQQMMTPSLFGGFRLFSIKHVQKLSDSDILELKEFFSHKQDDLFLLMEFGSPSSYSASEKGKTTALKKTLNLKKFEKGEALFSFTYDTPREYEMEKWLPSQVKELFNRKISPEAVKQLLAFSSFNVDKIYSELQKIDIYLADDHSPISLEAVYTVTGSGRGVNGEDLCNAIGLKRRNEVNDLIKRLKLQQDRTVLSLVQLLIRHFWKLYKIRLYSHSKGAVLQSYLRAQYREKNSLAGDIVVGCGIITEDQRNRVYPAIVMPKIIEQAREYTEDQLSANIVELSAFDRDIKQGEARGSWEELSQLCFSLCGSQRGGK